MTVVVTVESTGIQRRLRKMVRTLAHYGSIDLGQELSAWQVDDMHRHRPFTKRTRRKAATVIRPHSKYEVERSVQAQARARRRHQVVARSTRPILRDELLQKLQQRMEALAAEKIHW